MKSLKKFKRDESIKKQINQKNDDDNEKFGLSRMTKESIKKLCKKNDLYLTPNLNDVLYLHYQGYQAIESLEEYTSVKCLWLESNAIGEISGLDKQTELRCLFLHHNLIKKIENLQYCRRLDTINLSYNFVTTIENCDSEILPELSSLNLSHNKIQKLSDLEHLQNCKLLSVLDLSHNRIDDILLVGILAKMPELRVLVLTGNPVISQIPSYRKTLINECLNLTYLDSRPVFDRDRACAVAWKRGGYEEEQREMARWNKAERKKIRDGVNATLAIRRRLSKLNMTANNTDGLTDESNNSNENLNIELIPSTDEEDDENELPKSSLAREKNNNNNDGNIGDLKNIDNTNVEIDKNDISNLFNEVDNDDPIQKELYVDGTNILDDFNGEVDLLEKNRLIYDRLTVELEEFGKNDIVEMEHQSEEIEKSDEIQIISSNNEIILPTVEKENDYEKLEKSKELNELEELEESEELERNIHTKYKLKIQEMSIESLNLSVEPEINTQPIKNLIENNENKLLIDLTTNNTSIDSLIFDGDKSINTFLSSTTVDSTESSPMSFIGKNCNNLNDTFEIENTKSDLNSNSSELMEYHSNVRIISDTPPNLSENDFSNIDNNNSSSNSNRSSSSDNNEDSNEPNESTVSSLNKGQLIQTLLTSKSELFDLSTDDLNQEIEILNDNSQNFITEVINNVYDNRQLYNEFDLNEQIDEEINFEINIDQQKLETNQSGIRFYCENVNKLLIHDNCFSPICDDDGEFGGDGGGGGGGGDADEFIEILSDENEDSLIRSPEKYYTPSEFISNYEYQLDTNQLNTNLLKLQTSIEDPNQIENTQDSIFDKTNNQLTVLTNDQANKTSLKPLKSLNQSLEKEEPEKESNKKDLQEDLNAIDTINDFQFIKNLICESPSLNDFMASVPFEKYDETNNLNVESMKLEGYDSEVEEEEEEYEDACGTSRPIKEYNHYDSPEYQKFLKYMENIDHELYQNVHSVMLNASLEYEMLDELNKYGDPENDNQTDIIKRVEKYANEFKNHLSEEHQKKFGDQNAFWKKDLPNQQQDKKE